MQNKMENFCKGFALFCGIKLNLPTIAKYTGCEQGDLVLFLLVPMKVIKNFNCFEPGSETPQYNVFPYYWNHNKIN